MEELTQLYCLNHLNKIIFFCFFIFIVFIIYIYSFLSFERVNEKNMIVNISKGSNIEKIVDSILDNDNYFNKIIYINYLKIFNKYISKVKFGEFNFSEKYNLIDIANIITQPSNVYKSFKVIGGWQSYQLNHIIKEKFNDFTIIDYKEILADTYKYQSHNSFEDIYILMKKTKDNYFNKYRDKELMNQFSIEQIMIISSLVEKEGKTDYDKRLITSVILNRLKKNMRLQIDATTIFSITKGTYKLGRKLKYKDLKIQDSFNTYFIKGLPPGPICYVSRKTIEIVMENYKSSYLFYFFDENTQNHVFSTTYSEHVNLLNKYRKNGK